MDIQRRNGADHEKACERVATQFRQRWLRSYVRSKLRSDRIYAAAYDLLGRSAEPILDVGCGMGLLAFYLRERGCLQPILGLDLDARKVQRGAAIAAAPGYRDVELRLQDVEAPLPDFQGNVALLDVLHYLPDAKQTALLSRLAERVAPGGILIIRDSPREMRPRYWMTWLAEKFAQTISWNIDVALHFPSRGSIDDVFDGNFHRQSRPLWGTSPFNNHIFIYRRRSAGAAPAAEERNGSLFRSIDLASVPGSAD